ncbi:DNA repair protein RecO [Candidatus Berkiella aquae]|uniref:DNA repair protein RecO n=1 Tax=Candidatus Berkiella aquae TaxID=295108 RepID=UPI00217D16EC|nr:DNA repair protein RecO [Candidatus Berkiella aquae]
MIHSRPFRDSSAILDCLSAEHGLMSVVAKGVKKPRSRWHSYVQPFMLLQMGWIGKSELKTLTQVEAQTLYPKLTGPNIKLGLYINELLVRLCAEMDPHPQLFQIYDATLTKIAASDDAVVQEMSLREFEYQLLAELGYGFDLEKEIMPELLYGFEPGVGVVEAKILRGPEQVVVSGASILALQQQQFSTAAQLLEAKKLMRSILSYYLGNKPLQSRKLFYTQRTSKSTNDLSS